MLVVVVKLVCMPSGLYGMWFCSGGSEDSGDNELDTILDSRESLRMGYLFILMPFFSVTFILGYGFICREPFAFGSGLDWYWGLPWYVAERDGGSSLDSSVRLLISSRMAMPSSDNGNVI